MTIYTPYTYLIGWIATKRWYYGVRYAKVNKCLYESGCHPDEFWVTYFTSSQVVKNYIAEYGDPDVIQIRKTFTNEDSAIDWECKVLRKMGVIHDEKWLNESDGFAIRTSNVSNTGKLFWNNGIKNVRANKCPGDGWVRGMFLTKDQKNKRSLAMMGKNNSFYGKVHSDKTKSVIAENNRKIHTGMKRSKETIAKMSKSQKGKQLSLETRLRLSKANRGKIFSDETKIKMSMSRSGVKKSESHKDKIKESNQSLKWKCPHCNIEGGHGMFRWHFDNCRNKINS